MQSYPTKNAHFCVFAAAVYSFYTIPVKFSDKMATLDHLLEELFEACSVFDKFPVSFNRTLIDELVDCLDFEGNAVSGFLTQIT